LSFQIPVDTPQKSEEKLESERWLLEENSKRMIFPSQQAANERFCRDHNVPLEVTYSYGVNSIRLRGILWRRRTGKVMPVVMSTGWAHKIVNFSRGAILYDLLSDSHHILSRLLHPEKSTIMAVSMITERINSMSLIGD
jgi:hypothetical protein